MSDRRQLMGFETGNLLTEQGTSSPVVVGNATVEASIVRSGSYALKVAPASGAAAYWTDGSVWNDNTFVSRVFVRVTVLPTTTARVLLGDHTVAGNVNLLLNPSGTLTYRVGTTTIATSSIALTDTTRWYSLSWKMANSGVTTTLYIDGVSAASGLAPSAMTSDSRYGCTDTVADTYTAYFDDCIVDAALAAPLANTNIVMLVPASLSAGGAWREGDGAGTADMAAAVSTRPPPGLASANETSLTNIESAANSATDNCDMNMQTYLDAGLQSDAVVRAVWPIVRHGEDINTGSKSGGVALVSNPAIAEQGFTFGGNAGAHGAEVGNWAGTFIFGTNDPAVTLGTAPVMRVGKRTATTRVVCVDLMGVIVDYTPGTTKAPQWATVMSQAQHRASRW